MKELNFKSIAQMHEYFGEAEPENPLFSILHSINSDAETQVCENTPEPVKICNQFYSISLKNIIEGEILYGRTKYDCDKGSMLFMAPDQSMIMKGIVISKESWHIAFQKDYLNGYDLFNKIKKYNFFNYNANEALHLSPKEEKIMMTVFENIHLEYHNNQDEFSKEIIISHLETLLKYADRFYKRQFLNRQSINKALYTRFKEVLNDYFASNKFESEGIPTVEWLSTQLGVSHRYMSDTIKAETGKTAVDQINLYLIEEAKNLLLNPNASISETAYKLGFEYPQYFSRLFKKKTGMSPKAYIESSLLN
ncbi:helix-turn-helix domain-containing protein [Marinifilum caeruleilacunae]|uniref:AraC family transcriptional regulator n=1 Tax=Marinifilum caeruleilacunae TaxID=2499076 RepID=A0ABX1WQN3_9BACT|nr:AraC family transcriptional regulator [Marinifilum caeruleilacunae]NOU58368.1 AraC family transcriptional regulator [Marinifilum caeruleilacunae]